MRLAWCILSLLLMSASLQAHESYPTLRDPFGHLCCGDRDCEAVEQFEVHSDGSVTFYSRRYAEWIVVRSDQVTWIAVPGGPAHWCGHSIDDLFGNFIVTFCAFVDPGGS